MSRNGIIGLGAGVLVALSAFMLSGCQLSGEEEAQMAAAQADLERAIEHVQAAAEETRTLAAAGAATKEELEAKFAEVTALLGSIREQGLTGDNLAQAMAQVAAMQAEAGVLQGRYELVLGSLGTARDELALANEARAAAAAKVDQVAESSGTPTWLLTLGLGLNTIFSLLMRGLPSKGLGGLFVAHEAPAALVHRQRRGATNAGLVITTAPPAAAPPLPEI